MNNDRLARPLHTFARRGPTRTLDVVPGWQVLQDFPTLLFGDGGSMKSFVALYLGGRIAQKGTPVLLVDWELDGEDHRERLSLLFGNDVPTNLFYMRAEAPLASEAEVIGREIKRHGTPYVIFDSVGMATEGPPESSVEAIKYFRTLREIGARGSLGIAHVTKNGEAADQKPFGSAYWHNLARMTWSAKRDSSGPDSPAVRLVNRKTNLTAPWPDVRLQFEFGVDRIAVSSAVEDGGCVATRPEKPVSLRHQIARLLKDNGGQPMTIPNIAFALDANAETVARKVRQYPNLFVRLTGEGDGFRIGLVDRRSA